MIHTWYLITGPKKRNRMVYNITPIEYDMYFIYDISTQRALVETV